MAPKKKKASKKKKAASWKSAAVRKKVHKFSRKIKKQIGKNVKGDKAARERVFHGIAYREITGRGPQAGARGLAKKKAVHKKKAAKKKPKRKRL